MARNCVNFEELTLSFLRSICQAAYLQSHGFHQSLFTVISGAWRQTISFWWASFFLAFVIMPQLKRNRSCIWVCVQLWGLWVAAGQARLAAWVPLMSLHHDEEKSGLSRAAWLDFGLFIVSAGTGLHQVWQSRLYCPASCFFANAMGHHISSCENAGYEWLKSLTPENKSPHPCTVSWTLVYWDTAALVEMQVA